MIVLTGDEVTLAVQVVGACIVCWFLGLGSGAVVQAVRRLLGNAAR